MGTVKCIGILTSGSSFSCEENIKNTQIGLSYFLFILLWQENCKNIDTLSLSKIFFFGLLLIKN